MTVKIRFARFGLKHQPRYRIVVANSFDKRDGKHIEWLGSYNPFPDPKTNSKLCQLDFERAKYWLGVGAQPTDPVQRLFSKVNSFIRILLTCLFLGWTFALHTKRKN
jgi:small subunit ribosomal protein S16